MALETFSASRVARIEVGMVCPGRLAVGCLDLSYAGVGRCARNVKKAPSHGRWYLPEISDDAGPEYVHVRRIPFEKDCHVTNILRRTCHNDAPSAPGCPKSADTKNRNPVSSVSSREG